MEYRWGIWQRTSFCDLLRVGLTNDRGKEEPEKAMKKTKKQGRKVQGGGVFSVEGERGHLEQDFTRRKRELK